MKRIGRMTAIMALALTLGAISIGGALFMPPQAMAQAKKAEPPSPLPAAAPAAVPAIEAPKAEPPAVIKTTEVVENPYGLEALWRQGDWISKGTLIILAIMSVGSWYIGIVKLFEQHRLMRNAREADEKFWQAKSVEEGFKALHEDSAFRFIAEKGALAATHHGGTLSDDMDLNAWVGMSLQRAIDVISNRLQNGLAFLATVGSTAPFVGLFGTVWGIYHALTAIGIAGQASIDKVAGPVGEALIMTAFGLAVAVPAVLGYNWLVRRNRAAMELVRHFGGGVHMTLLGGGRKRGA
ncbi:MAG: biopolymer transporter ExbB [Betaproteobacteria bacterium RIFCSPLOWO2_02_FULL_66_14]|nr:MAG: biopolymer transporter ExbB [Betaproteobacteria bacterium RIFCSPLOWO2_02_FULL_66_14]